jgi:hypothetical protein
VNQTSLPPSGTGTILPGVGIGVCLPRIPLGGFYGGMHNNAHEPGTKRTDLVEMLDGTIGLQESLLRYILRQGCLACDQISRAHSPDLVKGD